MKGRAGPGGHREKPLPGVCDIPDLCVVSCEFTAPSGTCHLFPGQQDQQPPGVVQFTPLPSTCILAGVGQSGSLLELHPELPAGSSLDSEGTFLLSLGHSF